MSATNISCHFLQSFTLSIHISRPGGAGWQQIQYEAAVCPGAQDSQPQPGIHHTQHRESEKVTVPLYLALVQPHQESYVKF